MSNNEIDYIKNFAEYKTAKDGFELDYCQSCRKKYPNHPLKPVYETLWNKYNNYLNIWSGETLVSANAMLCSKSDLKRGRGRNNIDWDSVIQNRTIINDPEIIRNFCYSVACIGNYMPVPACEQRLLNSLDERFDLELKMIKAFYSIPEGDRNFLPQEIVNWLNIFVDTKTNKPSWECFVEDNYLKESFVNKDYEVVSFEEQDLSAISNIIKARTDKMIEKLNENTICKNNGYLL